MNHTLKLIVVTTLVVLLGGCSKLPGVHKITIQQGNVITQEMIDKLKPGMSRTQVAFIMGEPVMRNTFNSDRWDYVYSIDAPRYKQEPMRVSLYFTNDLLSHFTGAMAPTSVNEAAATDTGG